jgi:hypothetical protein
MKKILTTLIGTSLLAGTLYASENMKMDHSKMSMTTTQADSESKIQGKQDRYYKYSTKKDYSMEVKTSSKLKQGFNNIDVRIKRKSQQVNNADVILSILHPNNNVVDYKKNMTNKDRNYSFKVNLPEKGEYSYILTFSRSGGVIRTFRGRLSI